MPKEFSSGFDRRSAHRIGGIAGGKHRPLRIALVRQQYRPHGGAERFVGALAFILQDQGHYVTVIARRWPKGGPAVLECNPPRLGRLLRDWGFARAVRRKLEHLEFDLVQCHERIPGCEVYRAGDGVHREWLRQRRRVLSWSSRCWLAASPYHRYVLWAEKALFEHSRLRLVICNSRMVMHDILEHFSIEPAKLRVVYTGVDTTRFHPRLRMHRAPLRAEWGIPDEAPVFLFVGSGFELKGLRTALAALAAVEGCYLIVVGRDKAMRRYQRAAEHLQLGSRVRFVGVQRDVGPYFGAADAFVLPALYDAFPNVVLEAMASGLPVITTTKCGASELVREDHSGYICDALDVAAFSSAMRRLKNRDASRRMGSNARRSVEPLTPAAMRQQLLHIYDELLDELVRSAA
ncbi:MAG TPA: glycosyltransferase family 1 protein [Planctomycetaceae bacterium]|nr:glycosyltransferase family 1 protein [Planctomycetaceae bacterium]